MSDEAINKDYLQEKIDKIKETYQKRRELLDAEEAEILGTLDDLVGSIKEPEVEEVIEEEVEETEDDAEQDSEELPEDDDYTITEEDSTILHYIAERTSEGERGTNSAELRAELGLGRTEYQLSAERIKYLMNAGLLESEGQRGGTFYFLTEQGLDVVTDSYVDEETEVEEPRLTDIQSQTINEMYDILSQGEEVTTTKLAENLGVVTRSVRSRLPKLIKEGFVEGIGSLQSPHRTYRLTDKAYEETGLKPIETASEFTPGDKETIDAVYELTKRGEVINRQSLAAELDIKPAPASNRLCRLRTRGLVDMQGKAGSHNIFYTLSEKAYEKVGLDPIEAQEEDSYQEPEESDQEETIDDVVDQEPGEIILQEGFSPTGAGQFVGLAIYHLSQMPGKVTENKIKGILGTLGAPLNGHNVGTILNRLEDNGYITKTGKKIKDISLLVGPHEIPKTLGDKRSKKLVSRYGTKPTEDTEEPVEEETEVQEPETNDLEDKLDGAGDAELTQSALYVLHAAHNITTRGLKAAKGALVDATGYNTYLIHGEINELLDAGVLERIGKPKSKNGFYVVTEKGEKIVESILDRNQEEGFEAGYEGSIDDLFEDVPEGLSKIAYHILKSAETLSDDFRESELAEAAKYDLNKVYLPIDQLVDLGLMNRHQPVGYDHYLTISVKGIKFLGGEVELDSQEIEESIIEKARDIVEEEIVDEAELPEQENAYETIAQTLHALGENTPNGWVPKRLLKSTLGKLNGSLGLMVFNNLIKRKTIHGTPYLKLDVDLDEVPRDIDPSANCIRLLHRLEANHRVAKSTIETRELKSIAKQINFTEKAVETAAIEGSLFGLVRIETDGDKKILSSLRVSPNAEPETESQIQHKWLPPVAENIAVNRDVVTGEFRVGRHDGEFVLKTTYANFDLEVLDAWLSFAKKDGFYSISDADLFLIGLSPVLQETKHHRRLLQTRRSVQKFIEQELGDNFEVEPTPTHGSDIYYQIIIRKKRGNE